MLKLGVSFLASLAAVAALSALRARDLSPVEIPV
jgi:hypothetical protein